MSASPSTSRGPPRWVVLDDLDGSINYEGDSWYTASDAKANFETWDNGGFGLTYLGTLHATDSDAKMSFTFDGSAVVLSGSNNPLNESGIVTPSYECFLDGVKFGEQTTFPYPANNWDFCNWEDKDGVGRTHTLSLEVKTDGQTFFADKIKYVPTEGSKAAKENGGGEGSENVVEIPRGDLAIKLGEGWGPLGSTANFTTTKGATAEIEFYGTRLSWWAFIPGEFPKAATSGTYTIDDGRPTSFTLAGLGVNDPTTYHQMIFQTPSLPRAPHKMVVTYQGGGDVTPLPLTHVLVSNGNATAPRQGDPSVFELASMTSAAPSPSDSGGAKPTDGSEPGGSKSNIGAIVGGVVGALVLIAATIAVLFFLRRRRRKRDSMPEPVVIPFSPQQNSRPSGMGHRPGQASDSEMTSSGYGSSAAAATAGGAAGGGGAHGYAPRRKGDTGGTPPVGAAAPVAGSGGGSGFVPRRKGDVPPPQNPSRVMLHEDSGIRMNQAPEEPVEELPPVYTAQ
ncbi:hypothetical protein BKA70DRAFT_1118977 [Coprinopsis sp. MPI-PUGE-AT-0042]|nr:hypothetical protein BKA70DRAFT_1118977 [Coprinopsis sp. MPI-PUGE-AT-0042]